MYSERAHFSGFSLVELSIVLVILGLLTGGVLAGQSLIRGAEKRAQIALHDKIKTSVLVFRDKYMGLPGDLPNATSFWTAASQPERVTNGNGDGMISGITNTAPHAGTTNESWMGTESRNVYEHVIMAGLLEGGAYDETANASVQAGIAYPASKFNSSGGLPAGAGGVASPTSVSATTGTVVGYEYGYQHIHGGHKIRWTASHYTTPSGHFMFFAGLTPEDAWNFDTKMDDGLPLSGGFYATAADYIYRVPGDPNSELNNGCIIGGTNVYRIISTTRDCFIDIDTGF